jgi:hypothetical protein
MNALSGRKKISEAFLLLFPFAIWLWIHRGFWQGKFSFAGDNVQYFYWLTYHLDNFLRGVYPLWNPFHSWGSIDNFDIRFLGEFNPFYGVILLLRALGMSSALAFVTFSGLYFFVGCLGFFFLARRLTKDNVSAFLAYVLLMFSFFGTTFFTQLCLGLVLVPATWLFLNLLGFYDAQTDRERKKYFLGATFFGMLLLTTYMPFFILEPLIFLLLPLCLIMPKNFINFWGRVFQFCRKNYAVALIAGVSLTASCVPSPQTIERFGGKYLARGRPKKQNK